MPKRAVEAEVEVAEVAAVEAEVVPEVAEEEVVEPPKKKVRARKAKVEPEPEPEPKPEPTPEPKPKKKYALKVKEPVALAKSSGPGGMSGDFDGDDLDTPGFKLLHPLSPDASDTPDLVGSFVWNREVGLGKDIEVVISSVRKEFQEDCEYDPSSPPEIFSTREQAIQAGVSVKPRAIVDLLIPCTEENVDEALIELDEIPFLLARWYVQGAAYRKFMSPLRTHLMRTGENVWDRYYSLTASEVKATKGRMFVTTLLPTEEATTEGVRASCAQR